MLNDIFVSDFMKKEKGRIADFRNPMKSMKNLVGFRLMD
jgi:hypothetical protein